MMVAWLTLAVGAGESLLMSEAAMRRFWEGLLGVAGAVEAGEEGTLREAKVTSDLNLMMPRLASNSTRSGFWAAKASSSLVTFWGSAVPTLPRPLTASE